MYEIETATDYGTNRTDEQFPTPEAAQVVLDRMRAQDIQQGRAYSRRIVEI